MALATGEVRTHITPIADNDFRASAAERRMYSRLPQAARAVMLSNPSLQDSPSDEADAGGAVSWLVPPVLIPVFFAGAILAYALYRLVHLGPAAFS
jgi:hypothetical protein